MSQGLSQDNITELMSSNLRSLKESMKGIQIEEQQELTQREEHTNENELESRVHESRYGKSPEEGKQLSKPVEFDTIPDLLSSTHRSERLHNNRDEDSEDEKIQVKIFGEPGQFDQESPAQYNHDSSLENSPQNYNHDLTSESDGEGDYESIFPDYSELQIGIEIDADSFDYGSQAQQIMLMGKAPRNVYYYEQEEDEPPVRKEVINDVVVHKDNYHEIKGIDAFEFFTKPFIVISTNNQIPKFREDYDSLSIQSISELEGNLMFSPKKANVDKVQALQSIAAQGVELNPAFVTYTTLIQNNYKQILLMNTYEKLRDVDELHPKEESPSKVYVKYDQFVPLEKSARNGNRTRRTARDSRGKILELDKKGRPINGSNSQGLDLSPYDKRTSNFNRNVHGGSPNKTARLNSDGISRGYGDSVEDIANRVNLIVRECTKPEVRSSKEKLILSLKHLDKFFRGQYGQMIKTNHELKNFNKLIHRKNNNLLLVVETLDNETDKISDSIKILEQEEKKLSEILDDKDYYQEIGHRKIQKMNELDEVRRVVKNLKRRLADRKEELNEKRKVNRNLEELSRQMKQTFSENNGILRTTLKKSTEDGRIRDILDERTQSRQNSKKKYFYQSGAKRKTPSASGQKTRQFSNSGKRKPGQMSATKKFFASRDGLEQNQETDVLEFENYDEEFQPSPYKGPFTLNDRRNRINMISVEKDTEKARKKFLDYEKDFQNEGLRIYPYNTRLDDSLDKNPKKILNHRSELKSIVKEVLGNSKDGKDEFYNPHGKGPLIIAHAVNNPVTFNEKLMRQKVLNTMTNGLGTSHRMSASLKSDAKQLAKQQMRQ